MVRYVPPVRNLRPGHVVIYPNRGKAASKATKLIVILLLLISVVLMLIVTLAGWSKLQGLKPVNIAWALLYLVAAFYIARWNRGLLPLAAVGAVGYPLCKRFTWLVHFVLGAVDACAPRDPSGKAG